MRKIVHVLGQVGVDDCGGNIVASKDLACQMSRVVKFHIFWLSRCHKTHLRCLAIVENVEIFIEATSVAFRYDDDNDRTTNNRSENQVFSNGSIPTDRKEKRWKCVCVCVCCSLHSQYVHFDTARAQCPEWNSLEHDSSVKNDTSSEATINKRTLITILQQTCNPVKFVYNWC